jgi:hypothetical protein
VATVATAAAALALGINVLVGGYDAPPYTGRRLGVERDPSIDPVAAAEFVRGLPLTGNVFNELSFGAYLAWQWDGSPRIFDHGFVIDPAFYRDSYVEAMVSPGAFDRIMNAYDVDVVFLSARAASRSSGFAIYRVLMARPDWHLVRWDATSVVYLRDRPQYASVVAEHAFRYVDPYRPEALGVGMRDDPARVREELVRALRAWPDNEGLLRLAAELGVAPR